MLQAPLNPGASAGGVKPGRSGSVEVTRGDRVLGVADVEHALAGPLVGHVQPVAADVQVVFPGVGRADVLADQDGVLQIRYLPATAGYEAAARGTGLSLSVTSATDKDVSFRLRQISRPR